MIDVNLNELKYLITAPGFAYDTRRGVLCEGSYVSKTCHPLADVEALKTRLLEEGSIADVLDDRSDHYGKRGGYYISVRDIETGPLMARNLCSEDLMKELPDCEVALSENSDELIPANEALRLWSMYTADSSFRAKIEKDGYRVIKLFEAEYDRTFVNGKGDGSLSKVEQFMVDALTAAGAIDEIRRGDPADRECDIVDEKRMRQIEFVSLFDEKVPPRIRYRNEMNEEQALLMEYCDFGYNIVADGVINKFTLKNYTDNYSKELAIYMLGPNGEAADKVQTLMDMLAARINQIRNNYAKLHIILHDPLENETFVYCSNDRIESYPDSLCSYNIVERHPVLEYRAEGWSAEAESAAAASLDPDGSYIIITQSIFDPEQRSMHWVKGDKAASLL